MCAVSAVNKRACPAVIKQNTVRKQPTTLKNVHTGKKVYAAYGQTTEKITLTAVAKLIPQGLSGVGFD